VLALAASSAIVAKAMAANAMRERSGRIAASRIELTHSQCGGAGSGEDRSQPIYSYWVVAHNTSSAVRLEESVSYPSPDGLHTDTYRTALWCP
jgi:hypothetical protein